LILCPRYYIQVYGIPAYDYLIPITDPLINQGIYG